MKGDIPEVSVIFFFCFRYTKGNTGKPGASSIKPPDLWIHHDQMELKNMEKSSQGSLEAGPPARDLDSEPPRHQPTNSLDKRTYVSSYVGKVFFNLIKCMFFYYFKLCMSFNYVLYIVNKHEPVIHGT